MPLRDGETFLLGTAIRHLFLQFDHDEKAAFNHLGPAAAKAGL
jgi:hypothetical protein